MLFHLKQKIKKILIPRNKLLVFIFHQSTPVFDPQKNHKYIWADIKFFESQIEYLKNNFDIVKLDEAVRQLRSGNLKKTKVAITFDDGDASLLDYIIPILEKHNIPATFFINTSYTTTRQKGYWFNIYNYFMAETNKRKEYISEEIDEIAGKLRNTNDPDFYSNNYKKIETLSKYIGDDTRFYLGYDQLEKLNPELFSIGLHGHEHQRFSMMSKSWQQKDLLNNIALLSKFKTYTPIFAIPYGKPHDWNTDTIDICKEMGLEVAFANGGFNVKNNQGILRMPADGLIISKALSSLHPSINKYYS